MKRIFIANWKARKTIKEVTTWLKEAQPSLEESLDEVVICPDFVSLTVVVGLLKDTSLKVGAQDISQFETGPYTGEVTAKMLEGLAQYCLIGHSERRHYFGETNEVIARKVERAWQSKITPVICFENLGQLIERPILKETPKQSALYAYEPPSAIGTGKPESEKEAKKVLAEFKNLSREWRLLYGGSVDPENVNVFLELGYVGVLVGTASLEAEEFVKIVSKPYALR